MTARLISLLLALVGFGFQVMHIINPVEMYLYVSIGAWALATVPLHLELGKRP